MNNDPSMLYDEEFMKKREAMFKDFSPENDISSGRDKEDLFDEEDEEEEEETEKKGGFFSRLRKKKDYDDNDAPYDIFDLGEIEEKTPSKKEKKKEDKKDNRKEEKKKEDKKDNRKEEKKKASKKSRKDEIKEKKALRKEKKEIQEDYISVSDTEEKKAVKEEAAEEIKAVPEVSEEKASEEVSLPEIKEEVSFEEETVVYEPVSASEETFEEKDPLSDLSDINALLESVGIKPVGQEEETDNAKTKKIEDKDIKVISEELSDEKTKAFASASEEDKEVKEENSAEEEPSDGQLLLEGYKDEEAPKKEDEKVVEERLKTTRKNLIDNFRVLKNDADDSTLLEKDEGNINPSITDSLKTKEGEGIFEAIDKISKTKLAFQKVSEKAAVNKLQQKAKKERRKEQFVSAAAFSKDLKKERAKIFKVYI